MHARPRCRTAHSPHLPRPPPHARAPRGGAGPDNGGAEGVIEAYWPPAACYIINSGAARFAAAFRAFTIEDDGAARLVLRASDAARVPLPTGVPEDPEAPLPAQSRAAAGAGTRHTGGSGGSGGAAGGSSEAGAPTGRAAAALPVAHKDSAAIERGGSARATNQDTGTCIAGSTSSGAPAAPHTAAAAAAADPDERPAPPSCGASSRLEPPGDRRLSEQLSGLLGTEFSASEDGAFEALVPSAALSRRASTGAGAGGLRSSGGGGATGPFACGRAGAVNGGSGAHAVQQAPGCEASSRGAGHDARSEPACSGAASCCADGTDRLATPQTCDDRGSDSSGARVGSRTGSSSGGVRAGANLEGAAAAGRGTARHEALGLVRRTGSATRLRVVPGQGTGAAAIEACGGALLLGAPPSGFGADADDDTAPLVADGVESSSAGMFAALAGSQVRTAGQRAAPARS